MTKTYFTLYANCIPVKGATISVLCDIQRSEVTFIPNDLYEILITKSKKSIEEIQLDYEDEDQLTIKEYFEFLKSKEFIFICEKEELPLFPKLDIYWDYPAIISNTIIDIGTYSKHDFKLIFSQIQNLGCKDLQIRFFRLTTLEELLNIFKLLQQSSIKSIELYLLYNTEITKQEIIDLADWNLRISYIIVHDSDFEEQTYSVCKIPIKYTNQRLSNEAHCGIIDKSSFSVNMDIFMESQLYNSCLNRKISIDQNGEIKNCPSMAKSFGNISDITLEEALNKKDFKQYWNITKDQINICKDCEFRYICTDCRAYLQNPDDSYSKPLKCGYDPYTNIWEEWSTNPLSKKAIKHYGMQALLKKRAI
jgi:SPASM domain peptide maturase of grasp-with-spasm system